MTVDEARKGLREARHWCRRPGFGLTAENPGRRTSWRGERQIPGAGPFRVHDKFYLPPHCRRFRKTELVDAGGSIRVNVLGHGIRPRSIHAAGSPAVRARAPTSGSGRAAG